MLFFSIKIINLSKYVTSFSFVSHLMFLPSSVLSDIGYLLLRDDHGHHEHESYYGDRDTDSLVTVRT